MTRRLISAFLAALLGLHASAALADSDDLSTKGPMTTLIVSGDSRVYALTSAGSVVWRSTASREWTRVLSPSGVTFSLETGLASAQPNPSWGYPRVYAVSLPNGSTPAKLYELDAEANPNTWRPIGDASEVGQSLANMPSLAAVALPSSLSRVAAVAAVLRLNNGHVVTCRYQHSTDLCSWEDETYWGAGLAESGSPVEAVYNKDTTELEELFLIPGTPGARLQLLNWDSFTGQTLPALGGPWFVDTTGISGISNVGDFRVLVTAWDNSSFGDELYVADSTDGGSSWVWTHLDPESGTTTPHGRISWQSSPDQAYSSGYFGGVYDAFFISAYQDEAWACAEPSTLSGGTVTCSGSDGNMPPDLKTARDNLGQSIVGTAYSSFLAGYYDAYVTGTLTDISGSGKHMTYLYDMTNDPQAGHTWKNLLTARGMPFAPDGFTGEFSGAAYYGDVALIDVGARWIRSQDDGSTWTQGTSLFPSAATDPSLAYDAAGTLYATNTSGDGQIVRALPDNTWTSPAPIPPTQGKMYDRMWMAADKQRPDFLYVMWNGGSTGHKGYISYCNGSEHCDNASAWCPAWSDSDPDPVFQSDLHCGGKRNPTCLVEGGRDHVWVLISRDPACDPMPSPYDDTCGTSADPWPCGEDVALREIENRADLGPLPGGGCVKPILGMAHCLYFMDVAYHDSHQLHPETEPPPCYTGDASCLYPATYHRWSDRLAVSPDGDEVAVTVQGFRDTSDGTPCTPLSSQCRMDVFSAVFSIANNWCGPDGCTGNTIRQTQMFSANFDDTPPLGWADHLVPSTMMFAYGTVANSWYDFRDNPADDEYYKIRQSFFRLTDSGVEYDWDETPGSSTAQWVAGGPANGGTFYGDIDTTALSPLHALLARQHTVGGVSNAIVYLWSPDAYLAF